MMPSRAHVHIDRPGIYCNAHLLPVTVATAWHGCMGIWGKIKYIFARRVFKCWNIMVCGPLQSGTKWEVEEWRGMKNISWSYNLKTTYKTEEWHFYTP